MEGATNRFSTLSAHVLNACEVTEQTQAVRWFLERFVRRPSRPASTLALEKHPELIDDEVIRKAMRVRKVSGFASCGRVVGRVCIRRSRKLMRLCVER